MAPEQRLGQRLVGLALVLQVVPVCGALLVAETGTTGARAVLLVPLSPAARRALPSRALGGDTRLLGAGTLPGSLIVRTGDAAALPSWRDGVFAVRVPERLCGGSA